MTNSGENSEVRQDIGRLEGKVEIMLAQQQQLLLKQDAMQKSIQEQHSDHSATKDRVVKLEKHIEEKINPVIEDYKTKKLVSLGAIGGVGLAGGSVGAAITKFLAFIFGAHP